MEIKEIFI